MKIQTTILWILCSLTLSSRTVDARAIAPHTISDVTPSRSVNAGSIFRKSLQSMPLSPTKVVEVESTIALPVYPVRGRAREVPRARPGSQVEVSVALEFLNEEDVESADVELKVIRAPKGLSVNSTTSQQFKNDMKLIVHVAPGTPAGIFPVRLAVGEAATAHEFTMYVPVDTNAQSLHVFAINDYHGRIPVRKHDKDPLRSLGAVPLALTVADLRNTFDCTPSTCWLVSAGDNVGATVFESSSLDDIPTMEILRILDTQATAVGNHEFDKGYEHLIDKIAQELNHPQLGANVRMRNDGSPALPASVLWEAEGDLKIAFIGVVTADVPLLVSAKGIEQIQFTRAVDAANKAAEDAKQKGANAIILLSHQGATNSEGATSLDNERKRINSEFADIVNNCSQDVDVIMGGHTHKYYDWADEGRPVTQTGEYGWRIAHYTLTFDLGDSKEAPKRELVAIDAELVEAHQPNERLVTCDENENAPAANRVACVVDRAVSAAEVVGKEIVGSITASIMRARNAQGSESRSTESQLVNLVADALAHISKGAAAMMNPGGVRDDLIYNPEVDGNITVKEAVNVLPYANGLFRLQMTGSTLKKILEQQWKDGQLNLHLGVSGIRYFYDESKPEGDRVYDVFVHGEPLVAANKYPVVASDFLISGGDGFLAFLEVEETADTGFIDTAALQDYLSIEARSPDPLERAIDVAKDQTSKVKLQVEDADSLAFVKYVPTLMRASLVPETDIDGTFRIVWTTVTDGVANVMHDEILDEPLVAGEKYIFEFDVVLDTVPADLSLIFFSHTFDGNPFPNGIQQVHHVESFAASPITESPAITSSGSAAKIAAGLAATSVLWLMC